MPKRTPRRIAVQNDCNEIDLYGKTQHGICVIDMCRTVHQPTNFQL